MKQILTLLMLICCMTGFAQHMIQGTVTDSITVKPLEQANVMVLRGGKTIKFTKTDANGKFSIAVTERDELAVTYLGYRKQTMSVPSGNTVRIFLVPEDFMLKEVTVKGTPVFGHADTITYDLSRYATERDNTLSDVLKRLPGVDVLKNGTVSYQGEPISRLTVEGLDLTGGRYRKMTEALKAQDVDKAEIVEHDQPIKALQGKIFTDDVAMNIKLKDTARDKWLPTLSPQIGVGDDLYIDGKADVLQVGKERQQIYSGELDRQGKQLSDSHAHLATSSLTATKQEMDSPHWFSMPALNTPIDAERLRRNLSHRWSVDRITKDRDEREVRTSANYLHTTEWQTTSNSSCYYFGAEPIMTEESKQVHISRDIVSVDYSQKLNKAEAYGNEYFLANATFANGLSDIGHTVSQQSKQTELHLQNTFNRIFVHDNYQFSVYSDVEVAYLPSELIINRERQQLKTWQGYTHNYLSWLRHKAFSTYSLRGGIRAEHLNVEGNNTQIGLYLQPGYEHRSGKATLRLNLPIKWEYFVRQHQSYINLSPTLSFNIRQSNHCEWYLYGSYGELSGSMSDVALDRLRIDYRTYKVCSSIIPRNRMASAGMNYTYKQPIHEFFWVWRAKYSHQRKNLTADLQIHEGQYWYAYLEKANHGDTYSIGTDLSKGIFKWRLKTKTSLTYSYYKGQQASGGRLIGFSAQTLNATEDIIWSPSWCDVTYQGSFTRNVSSTDFSCLTPLLQWRQSLSLTKTIGKIDLTISGVHYHNELQTSAVKNTLLADASVVWRMKRIRLSGELHNLLNQKDYILTDYSGLTSSTTTYHLRPREVIMRLQWSFST